MRRGYLDPDNKLRASVVADPHFERKNTKDNTPAVVHMTLVPGNTVDVTVAAKGGGSENKSKFVMMNPSDSLVDWVLKTVPTMGAGWCPPGMLGIGIGGTAEKAMLMAKESADGRHRHARAAGSAARQNKIEELRIELYDKVNALGIGAQGLGGLTTVLDVKIAMYPTHAASKPVAMIPNCAATRHAHFVLDGSGPAYLEPPSLDLWPDVHWAPDYNKSKTVDLDTLTQGRGRELEARRHAAAQRQDAHRPRRRAQAHPGHAGQGRAAAGGLHATASSTTSARSIRCATRSSARPARPPRRAWTSSPR